MLHDYESWSVVGDRLKCYVPEAFSGVSIVKWYGNIERVLGRLLKDAEDGRNFTYADKVRTFLKIWRENEITGSINREQIDVLRSASDVLAVDNWTLNNFFSNLRDQLRMLIASEEELPRDLDMDVNHPMAGGGGGRGAPPMNPDFGPETNKPGDMPEEPGQKPPPGTPENPEANTGEPKNPDEEEEEEADNDLNPPRI